MIQEGKRQSMSAVLQKDGVSTFTQPYVQIWKCVTSKFENASFSPGYMSYICGLFALLYTVAVNQANIRLVQTGTWSSPPSAFAKSCLMSSDYLSAFIYTVILIPFVSKALKTKGVQPDASKKDRAQYSINIIRMSGVVMIIAMVAYAFEVESIGYIYSISVFGGLYNSAVPAIKALVSASVKGEQGVAMGSLSLVQTAVQLFALPVAGAVYKATSSSYMPATFLFLASVASVYLVLAMCMRAKETETLPVVSCVPVASDPAALAQSECTGDVTCNKEAPVAC